MAPRGETTCGIETRFDLDDCGDQAVVEFVTTSRRGDLLGVGHREPATVALGTKHPIVVAMPCLVHRDAQGRRFDGAELFAHPSARQPPVSDRFGPGELSAVRHRNRLGHARLGRNRHQGKNPDENRSQKPPEDPPRTTRGSIW